MAFSLRRKVVLAFGAAALVLVGVSIEAYRALGFASESTASVSHSRDVIEALADVVSDVVDAETSQRAFLLTGAAGFLAPYDSNVAEFAGHARTLRDLTAGSSRQRARVDSIITFSERRLRMLQARIDLTREGRLEEAIAGIRAGGGVSDMDSLRDIARRMDADERRLLAAHAAEETRRRQYSRAVTMIGLFLALTAAVFALAAILEDVSERERIARGLAAAAQREQEANRAKSEFLARMSHELRTPLNSVIGFANVLLKNKHGALRDQDLSFVERIRANGTHLLGIINDILDLSKVESGRMDLHIESVDVPSLVHETLSQINGRETVQLDVLLPPVAQPLPADRDKLKQVLLNLIANAIKFTEHGQVLVRVVATPDGRLRRIDVIDTGTGIPAERMAAIFNAFEQAESNTARRYGGTGLGLTIARAMCERMGFRLVATSTHGVGSTFSILCDPSEPTPATHVPPGKATRMASANVAGEDQIDDVASDADGSTILVIDDSADSRLLLSQFIEDDGKHVVTAVSAEQGLRLARELRPQLILLDLLMPGIDGWETLQRLKHDPLTAGIPVVITSILATEQRGTLLGALDLLDKPIDREELVATVRRNLAGSARRILVVEDDADTRTLVHGYLREITGLEVRMAETGAEALAQVDTFRPQLVILDLSLPGIDGLEVLRVLRCHPELGSVPVVIATARHLSHAERQDLESRTQAIVAKGANLGDDLRDAVRTLMTVPGGPALPARENATR
jgi:signal transduction histidine kinase/CheY-like chemotaxis protein